MASYLAHSACVTAIVLNYRLPRLGAYARPVRDMQDAMTKVRSDQMWSELLGPGFGAAARPTTFGVLGFFGRRTSCSVGCHEPQCLAPPGLCRADVSSSPWRNSRILIAKPNSWGAIQRRTSFNNSARAAGKSDHGATLLIHAVDDHVVPPANSQLYLEACRQHGPFCTYVTLCKGVIHL